MSENRSVVIKGGHIVDRTGERSGDVLIADGRIEAVGPELRGDTVLDAGGCIVAPGLVDLHASMGEPGYETAETIETASRCAALGGYTAVMATPDTMPCVDSASVVRDVNEIARGALCEVLVAGSLTVGRAGEQLSPMAEMASLGVNLFSDSPAGVQNARLMRRAMEYASALGVTVGAHCEDDSLSDGAVMNEGDVSSRLGLRGQPAEAEELIVLRDIALVRLTGARLHLMHLSSAGSIAMFEAAKGSGLPISADVTPQHLSLTDAAVETYDTSLKLTPPLRTETDRVALAEAVRSGVIDAVASDHSPQLSEDQELPFDQAPGGTLSLEYCLALILTTLDLDASDLVSLMSTGPARIAGISERQGLPVIEGNPANLCVFDPDVAWTIDGSGGASLSHNVAYIGRRVRGRVRHTIHAGEPVVIDGEAQR